MSSTTHRPVIERPDADTAFWLTALGASAALGVTLAALVGYVVGFWF